jgi:hypothetical protein
MHGSHRLAFGTLIALLLVIGAGSPGAHAGAITDEVSVDLASEIDKVAGIPERFAVEVPYRTSLQSHGIWTTTGNARTWSYRVTVPGAVSLSFHASRVVLPSGAALSVSGGGTEYRYTSGDIHRGELWSRIARGDTLTFTLTTNAPDASVALDVVGLQAGFRSLGNGGPNHPRYDALRHIKADAGTTSCVENWECHVTPSNQGPGQSSVTLVIANTGLCSGVLINNVAGDGTPYVLTARHCENGNADGGDPSAASGVTAYFDAVTPCGQTLDSVFNTETAVLSGAVTMVEQQDAWLIRFDGPIPITDAYFSGWDATGAAFVGGYTAHYGLGNSRQYTGWYGQAYFDQVTAAALGVHYASTFWDLVNQVGSVAPGASGSGLFDANNRLVGTLVRAQSQDSQPNSPGVCPVLTPPAPGPATATVEATALSGIFDSTADPESTTGTATLRTVLDPQNTGALTLNGKWMSPRFSPNNSTSPTGSSVYLNWNAPGATGCTASGGQAGDGWSGSIAASGTQAVTEYAAGVVTYFLNCTTGSAQSSASATITWALAAPTASLQVATGSSGFLNNPIQLSWSSTVSPCVESGGNAGDGWTQTVAANGTQTVNETAAGSYNYTVTCGSGSRSASAQFQVTFVAPVVTLQDGGITLANVGQPITLIGTGAGTNCANSGGSAGDGWVNTSLVANGGTFTLTESTPGTYTYKLSCSVGSTTVSANLTVAFSNGPPIVSMTTTPSTPIVGSTFVHVSWVASVAPCTLSVSGYSSHSVGNYSFVAYYDDSENVIGPYTYTVTCGTGTSTASATSTVNWGGTPQLTLVAESSPIVIGTPEGISWSSNVSPCTASGGQPGDGWSGTSTEVLSFLPVNESQPGTYTYTLTCGSGTKTVQAHTSITVTAGPVFATLTSSAASATEGTPVTLTWNSNTSPCSQYGDYGEGGWHNSEASSGTTTITEGLPGQHTYVLQCGTGLTTSATAQVVVTFTGPPQPTFTISPYGTAGQPFTLTWASADGSSCNATVGAPGDGWAGPRPPSGTAQVTELVTGPYSFQISCGISAAAQVGIEVYPAPAAPQPPAPANVELAFATGQTFANQPITLNWAANGVTSCTASGGSGTDNWQGTLPTSGSQAITEVTTGSYTFVISCTGSGAVTAQAILAVNPAPTASMSASASTVSAGQTFTLTWNSSETSGCTASGGTGADGWSGSEATSGSTSVAEAASGSYTYTVNCTAGTETVEAMAVVVVTAQAISGGSHSGGGALNLVSLLGLGLLLVWRQRRRSPNVLATSVSSPELSVPPLRPR